MIDDLAAKSIMHFHDRKTADPDWAAGSRFEFVSDAWHWIEENHRHNALLWNEEDQARRTDVEPAEIMACKRLIDRYNQKRNDAVEAIDEAILTGLVVYPRLSDARLNSETAGAMIDRLSILCLKIYHMGLQARRNDASADHIFNCETKLRRLAEQREDLAACFDQLLAGAKAGSVYFKVYRQFKMYNDPALNPYLYGAQGGAGAGRAPL